MKNGTASGQIQHIVIIIQENRSFNNLFMGYPGATTSNVGTLCDGNTTPLHAVPFEAGYDVGHGLVDFNKAYNNGAGGCFNRERFIPSPSQVKPPFYAYGYVPRKETAPYWKMAQSYALADEMFQSNIDASFTAHQYLIAGQAQSSVDIPNQQPWGCDVNNQMVNTITPQRGFGLQQVPCFEYPTLATELDAAQLSWRFYAPKLGALGDIWSAFTAIDAVRNGPEWTTNVISPSGQIMKDAQSGFLANVSWVVPDLIASDHSGNSYHQTNYGPQWVSAVVDAIGNSQFWNSTAIFVVWDDWGGWYDPVVPQYLDYDGLGFRVPLIAISPYSNGLGVAHTHYEFGSILKFAEQNFGLGTLVPGGSDDRANPFGSDIFNFGQQPAPFTPFAKPNQDKPMESLKPSYKAPDNE